MIETISIAVFTFFKGLGIFGAFLSMIVENLGIPLPTEIGYLIGQDLVQRQVHSYPFMLLLLTSGHVIGALISYWVGRMGEGYVVEKLKQNSRVRETHTKIESWYKRYGTLTVFITRFVGYVRPWSSFVAGFAGVEFWPFLIWTTIGSLIFNIIGLYFSGIFILVWRRYEVYHILLISLIAVLFFGVIIYEMIKYVFSFYKRKGRVEEK